jgi:hypothetical protein
MGYTSVRNYLYGLAIDPADPNTIVVSASQSAWQAHSVERANSLVYRRSKENDGEGNGKQFQMVFRNQKEQLLLFLPQTQKIKESSMPLTTAGYFVLLIQVLHGES